MPDRNPHQSGYIFLHYSDRGYNNPMVPFPLEDTFLKQPDAESARV